MHPTIETRISRGSDAPEQPAGDARAADAGHAGTGMCGAYRRRLQPFNCAAAPNLRSVFHGGRL